MPAPNRGSQSDGDLHRCGDEAFAPVAIVLASVTLLVLGRLCFNGFTGWDDNLTLFQNPRLNPPTLAAVRFYFLHAQYRLYAPLTYFVWSGLALLARTAPDHRGVTLDPLVFHAANLLLHLLASLVVCRILLMLRADGWAALCGSLAFAIHPIQVEAVAWASGLKDVLSGLLVLTALWQYLEFAIDAGVGRRNRMSLARCVACLILAMLAKSSAATMPLAAIALEWQIARRPWKSILASSVLLVCVVAPFVVIAHFSQEAAGDLSPPALWQRPLIAADAVSFYLLKLIWPIHLCFDYGRTPQAVMQHAWIYAECLVPSALTLALIAFGKSTRPLLAAAMIFLAGCLPTLGFLPFGTQSLSTTADHYLYWAMAGPAIAIAWAMTAFRASILLRGAIFAALAAWAVVSVRQGAFWKDDYSLFSRAIAINPKSYVSYNNLGYAYYLDGNDTVAVEMYRRSIGIKPDSYLARSNLAAALREMGHLDEANHELRLAIRLQELQPLPLRQTWSQDLMHLGRNLLELGQPAEAVKFLKGSLAARPDQPEAIALLARAEAQADHPATTHGNP
jgi:tetratricopeptide (TPR) repeat protein